MLGEKLDPMRPLFRHLPPSWRMYATSQLRFLSVMFENGGSDLRRGDKRIQDDV
jgi:hypothetical protein